MKKQISRRRFLALSGVGAASTVVAAQASQNLTAKFLGERLGDLAKPCEAAKHRPDPASWDNNRITASWLGHATVLINFQGLNILTDPVLFSRVGANFGLGTFGPLRRQSSALKARALPKIDLVLVSHAHLDHLDIPSLQSIQGRPTAVTAKATRDLFQETPMSAVHELKWGESVRVNTDAGGVEVEAFQVRHWGARWRRDTQRGYNGYIVSRGGKKIIFGGDTALCDGFKNIRGKGGFEFACMPIGAYNPWVDSHCTPEQALQMANDCGAKYVLPMHHYTFRFGREECQEPIQRLEKALNGEKERLALREAGETFVLPA